jgi:hypothetical protein
VIGARDGGDTGRAATSELPAQSDCDRREIVHRTRHGQAGVAASRGWRLQESTKTLELRVERLLSRGATRHPRDREQQLRGRREAELIVEDYEALVVPLTPAISRDERASTRFPKEFRRWVSR